MLRSLVFAVTSFTLGAVLLLGTQSRAHGQQPAGKEPPKVQTPDTKGGSEYRRRPSYVIAVLIEMSHFDPEAREELQLIYDALRKLDKNNDGKLDLAELDTARKQILEGRADHLIQKLGKSKPGAISKAEAQGRLKEHFDEIDTNRDGYIDRAELIAAMNRAVKADEPKATPKKVPDR
jgi:Ca2+-binding EF-hand superfamily protein